MEHIKLLDADVHYLLSSPTAIRFINT